MSQNEREHGSDEPWHVDAADAAFDASLRAAAERSPGVMPAAPSRVQIAQWRAGTPEVVARVGSRTGSPRRWFAGVSAAAAMVAVGAVAFFTLPVTRTVQAGTILSSLRSASVGSIRITLNNVQQRGITATGELVIHFPQAFPMERVLDENAHESLPEPDGIVGVLDISMDETAPVPGMTAHAEGAMSADSTWLYVRSSELPADKIKQVPPFARMIPAMLKNGLMLDLGAGVPEKLKAHEHAGAARRERRALEVGAGPDGVRAGVRKAGGGGAGEGLQSTGLEEMLPQIRAMLAGEAGATELEDLRAAIGKDADGSAVIPQGDGRYLLTIVKQHHANHNALVKVSYLQGRGVEWVEISRVEGTGGSMRIELLDHTPIEAARFEKSRVIEEGRTMVITQEVIEAWGRMLESLGGQPDRDEPHGTSGE